MRKTMASDVDIEKLFEPGSEEALKGYLRLLHPADVAELFSITDAEDWRKTASFLPAESLADVLAEIDEEQQAELGEALNVEQLIRAVDELETDDAADIVAALPEDKSAAVLDAIEDRELVTRLMSYPDDSAGGIMQTELCRVYNDRTVNDAITELRAMRDDVHDVHRIYLVDAKGCLTGTVRLEDLVLSAPATPLYKIQTPIEHRVLPETDQEQVASIFKKYDLASLPVVSDNGELLGRITFDDVHDVLVEEASEDILTMAGTSGEELVSGTDVVRIAMFRLPWLFTSMLGSLVTAFVLSQFESLRSNALLLASFVPVVSAMTGNIGSQTAMIITRGLAIGKVDWTGLGHTFLREGSVALLMGSLVGGAVGLVAHFWRGMPGMGVTIGLSLVLSMLIASLVGTATPVLFKKVGIDPAIAAGPLVTTGCDIMSVSLYLMLIIVRMG